MVTKDIAATHKLKKATLSAAALTQIGLLIRSFAEIEDIVNLWLAKMADSQEAIIVLLMGRAAISTKMTALEALAQIKGETETTLYNNLFVKGFRECLTCRNAVAPGVFLGKDPNGAFAFQTVDFTELAKGKAFRRVLAFGLEDLKEYATIARDAIPTLERSLGLAGQRRRYLLQTLVPRSKGQNKKSNGSPQKRQPHAVSGKAPKLSRRQQREARIQAAKAAVARGSR